MRTFTITVRIVPCPDCAGRGAVDDVEREDEQCRKCDGRGEVVATSERLLVGYVLAWDRFR